MIFRECTLDARRCSMFSDYDVKLEILLNAGAVVQGMYNVNYDTIPECSEDRILEMEVLSTRISKNIFLRVVYIVFGSLSHNDRNQSNRDVDTEELCRWSRCRACCWTWTECWLKYPYPTDRLS